MKKKKIILLGSTGSIGVNTLKVIEELPEKFEVVGLSANSNINLLKQQINKFNPKYISIGTKALYNKLKAVYPEKNIFFGMNGLLELSKLDCYDTLVVAVVGAVGLLPVIEGIKNRKQIAIANKEPLVMAGHIINDLLKKYKVELLPIDSEHSAIFQSLKNEKNKYIENILLTASGGPFYNKKVDFSKITPEQALLHPNWNMGKKISIDSATLMNKGLEVIEAYWLFKVQVEKIKVVIHPQSIIHSMVEFIDGSIIAQLGPADMKLPILYSLSYPERWKNTFQKLKLVDLDKLTFIKPNIKKFKCLQLAFDSIKAGGIKPTILNASNEIAVENFLNKRIKFSEIPEIIDVCLNKIKNITNPDVEVILNTDKKTRRLAKKIINEKQ